MKENSLFDYKDDFFGFMLQNDYIVDDNHIYYFIHKYSGIKVVVEKNNNINKRFEIAFKTPSFNDRGVAHVLEHCILSKNKKYASSNILSDIINNAYSTFVNAVTYPLYTTYILESVDNDELRTMAQIYLDCIFNPLFLYDESIFLNEAINYKKIGNKIIAQGCVFNEMKDVMHRFWSSFSKIIFRDTQDKNYFGGLPECIMDLSFKEACDYYRSYYWPSNSIIAMSGDVDFIKILEWLDSEYLNDKPSRNINISYKHQDFNEVVHFKRMDYYNPSTVEKIKMASVVYLLDSKKFLQNIYAINCFMFLIKHTPIFTEKLKSLGYTSIKACVINKWTDPLIKIDFYSYNGQTLEKEPLLNACQTIFNGSKEYKKFLLHYVFRKKLSRDMQMEYFCPNTQEFIMSFARFNNPLYIKSLKAKNFNLDSFWEDIKEVIFKSKPTIISYNPYSDIRFQEEYKILEKLKNISDDKLLTDKSKENEGCKHAICLKNMFKDIRKIKTPSFSCSQTIKEFGFGKLYYELLHDMRECVVFKIMFKADEITGYQLNYVDIIKRLFSIKNDNIYSVLNLEYKVYKNIDNTISSYFILEVKTVFSELKNVLNYLKNMFCNTQYIESESIKTALAEILSSNRNCNNDNVSFKFNNFISAHTDLTKSYILNQLNNYEADDFILDLKNNIFKKHFINKSKKDVIDIISSVFIGNNLCSVAICCNKKNIDLAKKNIFDLINNVSVRPLTLNHGLEKWFEFPHNSLTLRREPQNLRQTFIVLESKKFGNLAMTKLVCQVLQNLYLTPLLKETGMVYGISVTPHIDANRISILLYKNRNFEKSLSILKEFPKFLKSQKITNDQLRKISKSLVNFSKINMVEMALKNVEYYTCKKRNYWDDLNHFIESIKNITSQSLEEYSEIFEQALNDIVVCNCF